MTAPTAAAACRHCLDGLELDRDGTRWYWFHLDSSSVWCDPIEAPKSTRAEPVPAPWEIYAAVIRARGSRG